MNRLVVLSYHSLEDRRVKQLFRTGSPMGTSSSSSSPPTESLPWMELFRRARGPSEEEIVANRRSRSAKLRAAVRMALPGTLISSSGDATIGFRGRQKSFPLLGAKQLAKLAAVEGEEESEEEVEKPIVFAENKISKSSVFTFRRRRKD